MELLETRGAAWSISGRSSAQVSLIDERSRAYFDMLIGDLGLTIGLGIIGFR